ncbi:MAG: hypothetical protein LBC87_03535 [Fibromonadaceae bacterium]|jgi:hypothetical protein|nr:hypothetical protein [Fibromonadaceae bacterium]
MKNSHSKLTLAVGFLFALTFTFGCSSDDGGGNDGSISKPSSSSAPRIVKSSSSMLSSSSGSEQSYKYCITADGCLDGPFTASTCTGQLSNSCPNGSSPSVGGQSSSITRISSSSMNNSSSSSEKGSSSSVANNSSSSAQNGSGITFNENSQIYIYNRYDGGWYIGDAYTGSGVIKLIEYSEDGNEILINAGNVTNGIVKLELPPTIPDEYFKNLLDEDEQSYCTDYPTDIKVAVVEGFKLFNSNGELLGRLNIEYRDEQIREYIEYWYFTKAGKITCDLGSIIVKMDAKVGLNKTYYHTNYSIIERSTISNVTKVKWVIRIE